MDVPFDQELPQRALLDALCSIPQTVFDDWQTQAEQQVLEFVEKRLKADESAKDALGTDTPTPDTLKLATAIFLDGSGGCDLTYPAVLVWPKLSGWTYGRVEMPWSISSLRFGNIFNIMARRMVELAGGHPHTMTIHEMDKLDPWYHFAGDPYGERIVYSWRCVLSNYRYNRENRLALLGPSDTATARACLAAKACTLTFRGKDALCAHCSERFSESEALYGHIREAHARNPVTLHDFVPGLDIDYASIMCVDLQVEPSSQVGEVDNSGRD
ncbi:hypothetical protein BD626DRAFT_31685 [Schizophyllum amplum]|uniref:C2H2-type domain-containing protein n=1 Tax=Schizophyllum amplum TaxID=97359 RepID=A0A550D0T8_9AGAR|nr:hypothetical protein BD626DRAFT_31685 [Auriculariopsis ampla]